YYFSRRKETEIRKQEMRIRFLQQQIEELYAPLWALIEQSEIIYGIACKKLPIRDNGRMDREKFTSKDNEIYVFFNENYFLPINSKITDLIQKKMHLLYNGILPESFDDFIHHQIMGESLYRLWKAKNIDSSGVRGKGYPATFKGDVKSTLNQLRQEYLDETTIITKSTNRQRRNVRNTYMGNVN
ncbi:MAG: hypothetical protein C3F07_20390, partial [Anaerolineales bacterium]